MLARIAEQNRVLLQANDEYNELRAELGVIEGRNYAEKRDIERIEADLREATALSHKFYAEIQRLRDLINQREVDLRGFRMKIEQLESEIQ